MRVVQINTVCGYGSTGRTCSELGAYLHQRGDECYVAYGQGRTEYPRAYRIGSDLESKLHNIGSRLFCRQGCYSKGATRRLVAWLEQRQPDIVHLRNLHGNYLNYRVLFTYLARVGLPVVWTLHDCWAYTGKCVHYTDAECHRWRSGCHDCVQIREYPSSLGIDASRSAYHAKRSLFTSIDRMAVVTVSDWLRGEVAASFLSRYPVTRIHNWIDASIFGPVNAADMRTQHQWEGKFVVLGVSSGWPSKRLAVFHEISRALGDSAVICLVGGMRRKPAFPANMVFVGETQSTRELAQYYSMADVFVNPSVEESFGKVTAEAMACGTPCVVYNSTASPELIGENCGYVVGKHDIGGMVSAIEEIRSRGKAAYQAACVAHAHAAFNYQDRAEDYRALYRQLLEA